jgi:hypothetical protein
MRDRWHADVDKARAYVSEKKAKADADVAALDAAPAGLRRLRCFRNAAVATRALRGPFQKHLCRWQISFDTWLDRAKVTARRTWSERETA